MLEGLTPETKFLAGLFKVSDFVHQHAEVSQLGLGLGNRKLSTVMPELSRGNVGELHVA